MKKILFIIISFILIINLTACNVNINQIKEDAYLKGVEDGYQEAENDYSYIVDEEWYDGYDFGYEEGVWDTKKEFGSIINKVLEAGCYYIADESPWHPEEALVLIEGYNQDPSSVSEEDYLSAIETLCNYFKYFYYGYYIDSLDNYID